MEAHGDVRVDGGPLDLARRRIHARGDVGRDDGGPAAVDRLDRGVRRGARRSREAGAEDRVHDDPRALERRRDLAGADLDAAPSNRSRFAVASGDSSSAGHSSSASTSYPVPASCLAATSPSPPLLPLPHTTRAGPGRAARAGRIRHRRSRRLHQLQRRHLLLVDRPGVGRTHPGRVIYGLQPGFHLAPSVIG